MERYTKYLKSTYFDEDKKLCNNLSVLYPLYKIGNTEQIKVIDGEIFNFIKKNINNYICFDLSKNIRHAKNISTKKLNIIQSDYVASLAQVAYLSRNSFNIHADSAHSRCQMYDFNNVWCRDTYKDAYLKINNKSIWHRIMSKLYLWKQKIFKKNPRNEQNKRFANFFRLFDNLFVKNCASESFYFKCNDDNVYCVSFSII